MKIENNEEQNNKEQDNYMGLGMCLGMMGGSAVMSILTMFGQIAWGGLTIGIGLLV